MGRGKCGVAGCDRAHYAKGWCVLHWARYRKNGTTDLIPKPTKPRPPCGVADCEKPSKTRGMCGMHAERARNGSPLEGPKQTAHGIPFERRYALTEAGCWEWIGPVSSAGYGTFRCKYAHRVSYELHVGPIPDGLVIDHLCRNTRCVNPAHLEAVPTRLNVLRGISPIAIAVQMNRCGRGHEFTPENTQIQGPGYRACKACRVLRDAERKSRVSA